MVVGTRWGLALLLLPWFAGAVVGCGEKEEEDKTEGNTEEEVVCEVCDTGGVDGVECPEACASCVDVCD